MQTLINEVRQLRQENINFFNELSRHHAILFNMIQALSNRIPDESFPSYVERVTKISTAEFTVKHMSTIQPLNDRRLVEKFALEQANLDGLFMEFGVFQGSSINFFSEIKPDKIFYGFDSFEGLPEDWRKGYAKSSFNANGIMPQVNENVRLIKGMFDETLPKFVEEHKENCAFIHIDCDLYSSTKTVFDALKDKIVSGTIILFDEYFGYPGWQNGEYKAFKEFTENYGVNFEYIMYTANYWQVAVKIK